jgi:hypothetical protein
MAAGGIARERADNFITVKIARNMAHRAVGVKLGAVPACDPGGFLPPVLKRVQPKRHECSAGITAANPKNPAFFAKFIVIKRMCGQHESARLLRFNRAYRRSDLICRAFVTLG